MTDLADRVTTLAAAIETRATGRRLLVGIVGPPGSGKSTLAEALVARLQATRPGRAALLSQDGFHYDDAVLDPAGMRPRKGAPETFDVAGLVQCLKRLAARDEAAVAVPVFDRAIEIARAGARLIEPAAEIVVVEGNWLLLDEAPWRAVRPWLDLTAMLQVPEAVLRERLEARWRDLGFDEAAIAAKVDGNDLPNARRVLEASAAADLVL
ncbi:nucleoside/nucleotide kinase family protein [Prosthecodimorpha staleyi]|uniref:Nucleoside/nucleotide kinase family protein n=1 Tax=Prosthecodimorpha staleyi TaxID=2840188 RepID=A0A947D0V8_9HYPH|nr:nucleoside/nucleotide kinase family protein [Prosthecodimorpha staleyi]MBT9288885.1 nucleoside/nucleotide kinase family protein [Prosthecodimorpha staleyi]